MIFKKVLSWLRPKPRIYPPWDVRSGPDVFCNWLCAGDESGVLAQLGGRETDAETAKSTDLS